MRDGYEGVGTYGCCLSKIFRVRGGGELNRFGRCTWSEFVSRACSSRATYLLSIVSVGVFVCRYVCMYVCLWTVRI